MAYPPASLPLDRCAQQARANRPAHSADEEHECSEERIDQALRCTGAIPLARRQRFMAMAKNKAWDKDLYTIWSAPP